VPLRRILFKRLLSPSLLSDEDLAKSIAEAGRKKALEKYSPERHYAALMEIFGSLSGDA